MTAGEASTRVRASTLADYDGVAGVVRRAGMEMVSRQEYERRWTQNPFRPEGEVTTGWLMETGGGEVVGWFGNIYTGYEWNGRNLLAASTHAVAVDAEYRKRSLGLLSSFFRQRGVDLLLATTANSEAGKAWMAFKALRLPHDDYDRVLYWVTDRRAFYAAALRRKGVPLAGGVGGLMGLDASVWPGGGRWPKATTGITTRVVETFDERFGVFWDALRKRPNRLHAVRTPEALRWHYADAMRTGRLAIVTAEEGAELSGYAVLIRRDQTALDLRRYVIADLQVGREDAGLVAAIVRESLACARLHGVAVVEANGFDAFKRGVLAGMSPAVRRTPHFPFLYKAQDAVLAESLRSASSWDPCPYDGDAAF